MSCQVLRCTNPAGRERVRLTAAGALRREAAVCAEHKAQIDAGVPWRWEQDVTGGPTAGYIVMGADLDVSQFTIANFKGTEEHGLVLAHDGGPGTTLVFERVRADGSRDELRLLVGERVLDQLSDTFDQWLRPRRRDGSGDSGDTGS